jgi:hypothetical protein
MVPSRAAWHRGDASSESWANGLDQLAFTGSSQILDVPFCHRKVCTLLLDNLIHIHLVLKVTRFIM